MLPWLSRRKKREAEIQEEIAYHLDKLAEAKRDQGAAPQEAESFARRKFGNATLAREKTREVWIRPAVEHLLQDLRYALRGFRKHPAFSITAVLSLALGIGANTAIFSLIDALLLRMLPVPDPKQLVEVVTSQNGRQLDSFPYPGIKALEQRATLFSNVCGFSSSQRFSSGPPGAVRSTFGAWVTGTYYQTLGIHAALGRVLMPTDDLPGGGAAGPVAVLSYSYWENQYHRDPNAIGKTVLVDGQPVAIVGVSAPGFAGANVGTVSEITLPLAALPQLFPERARELQAGSWWLRVLGRLKPAVSEEQAKAQLTVLWPQIAKELVVSIQSADVRKAILGSTLDLIPGSTGWSYLRQTFARPLSVLLALVTLVLLVACVNVANLLLTRAAARSKEFGVRLAIGAGAWRLLRQLLTESLLLALLGAGMGIGFAYVADRLLLALASPGNGIAPTLDVRPDLRVLCFTAAVALVTGILFGLAPALRATSSTPEIASRSIRGARHNLSSALIILQVAFSLLLLVGAGLFLRTLQNLQNLDMGFRREGVLLVNLDPRHAGYEGARLVTLYQDLLQEVAALPGVASASISWNTPLSGLINSEPVLLDGRPPEKAGHRSASFNNVSPAYFSTLGTPLLLGRDFRPTDNAGSQPVALVNEQFIRTFLDGGALGRRVSSKDAPAWQNMEIIGVVKDTVSYDPRQAPPPAVYAPFFQAIRNIRDATIEIRAQGSLASVADVIRQQIHRRLPDTALNVVPLSKQVEDSIVQERLVALLAGLFGLVALALAGVGLYGVLAYAVSRRTTEIGVRMALGATRSNVLRLVLRRALLLVGAGTLIGLPLALAGALLISKMLFGIKPADLGVAASSVTLLFVAGTLAAYLPARRASRVDPLTALRHE